MPDSHLREFGQWITQHPWTEVLAVEGVQEKWDIYINIITQAFHRYFPLKQTRTHPADAPWITPRIKRLIQQRAKAFYTDINLFRQLRNKVIREIKRAKKMYYPNKIKHLQQNSSLWFNRVKSLCGMRQASDIPLLSQFSPDLAAEQINDHFASICQTLPLPDKSDGQVGQEDKNFAHFITIPIGDSIEFGQK
ncbi:uncharacterized protein LOC143017962 [Oratosquilla oratoria]|uniref:uncharacterized protein LOC143017962 n=1 Tax=Oratosquilla oratoria TaxID=337810 RepID=UPI003F76B899